MGLFSSKADKKKPEETKAAAAPVAVNTAKVTDRNLESVILRPHMTEKAVGQSEKNVYTFVVRQNATKYDVRDAVTAVFGVTPVKVNIVKKAPRTSFSRARGKNISEAGMKKAYVYLKDGDTISVI